jgi:hypothetical protein
MAFFILRMGCPLKTNYVRTNYVIGKFLYHLLQAIMHWPQTPVPEVSNPLGGTT